MPLFPCLAACAVLSQGSADIEVPFRISGNAIIVDAKVNGRDATFMFDTGFGGSILLDASLDVGPATGKQTLRDFVGQLEVNTVKLKTLSLGAKTIAPGTMRIVQQSGNDFTASYGTHVDGIMGLSVIKDTVTEINFEKKRFIFHPSSYNVATRTPDNKKTFLTKMLPIGGNSIELAVTTDSGQPMTLALDTGNAFYATTHRDVLERVGLWDAGRTAKYTSLAGVASGSVESWSYKMPPLNIFGVPVGPTVWDIIDLPSSSAEGDGTVGFGFLSHFNMVLDYDRRRVWFEKWDTPVENQAPGEVGISAGYNPGTKRVEVALVSPDSPASEAGVKVGDQILSIDGEDVGRIPARRMRQILQGPPDSTLRLALSRQGALKRVELKRRPLVNEKQP